jgi:glutamine amidotransferase
MSELRAFDVAIVDYGLGNLFSVKQACEQAGMRALVTSRHEDLRSAPAVVLPGVGAFGDAMRTLEGLGLIEVLREVASEGKILLGICLGMQLLMQESHEFGRYDGLGIIDGDVVPLPNLLEKGRCVKVPQVGWNRIHATSAGANHVWKDTVLGGLSDGEYMYFVHSFYCRPERSDVVLATTSYGQTEFCSAVRKGNVFGCQFHPERSGFQGVKVYRNLADMISRLIGEEQRVQ